jgi:putative NADPH-quinone reductase
MKDPSSVLLLVGSPRGSRSTSESLGDYLLKRLHAHGLKTEKVHIHLLVKSAEGRASLLRAFDSSDLAMLSFPLYFDGVPSPVIAALEIIAEHRGTLKKPRM